jgi:PAS domain S-box-containing protein
VFAFFQKLFSSDFLPHAHCFLQQKGVLWLHVASDAAITLAYYSIPFTLLYFVRHRRDLAFNWMFLMFGAFIFGCGTTHLFAIWTLWHPIYRAEGLVKLATGALSLGTAAALIPLVPKALALPSRDQLEEANRALAAEVLDRQNAEHALRESQQWLTAMARSVGDGVIATDRHGLVSFMSALAERLTGHVSKDAAGRPLRDVLPLLNAETREPLEDPVAMMLRSPPHLRLSHKATLVARGGIERPVEFSVAPIEGLDGTMSGVVVVFRDVSARRQAEEELRERSAVLQSITESVAHYVDRGDWQAASEALLTCALRLTGSRWGLAAVLLDGSALRVLSRSSVDGAFGAAAAHAAPGPTHHEMLSLSGAWSALVGRREVVLENEAREYLTETPFPPGQPTPRRFLGVPVLRGDDVVGVMCVADRESTYTGADHARLESLTQIAGLLFDGYRRGLREGQLQQQLVRAQRMEAVGRLAGGVAHDFNNLLTAILGYTDLVAERLGEAHASAADVIEIRRAAERATGLTSQLLAFARRQVMEPRVLDLNSVVHDMDRMLRRLLGDEVQLVTQTDPELWPVRVDRHQIEQVLVNLAVNARDAMPNGGVLALETANVEHAKWTTVSGEPPRDRSCVSLRVRDTGLGMNPDVLSHIFEPFFTTKDEGKGTGLGLSTAYGIVQQSGGTVSVESEPGAGTCFTVLLPRATADDAEPAAGEAGTVRAGVVPRGRECLLLVEDQPTVRRLLAAVLRENGYTVIEASNGEEALLECLQHPQRTLDLLVTDVRMPVVNGRELAHRLRQAQHGLRVLFISGFPDDMLAGVELHEPGIAFLAKPFTPDTLARQVRELLDEPSRASQRPDPSA